MQPSQHGCNRYEAALSLRFFINRRKSEIVIHALFRFRVTSNQQINGKVR